MLGNGYGWFQPPATYSPGGQGTGSVVVADVNGDGKPDLIVSNACGSDCSTGVVGVLRGNGDGTFQPPVSYSSGGNHPYSVAVGDVNGDGKPDLLVANDTTIGVLLGNGDGTFRRSVTYGSGGSAQTYSEAVADVNGDGNLDVVVANGYLNYWLGGTVGVLLGNGDGTFQTAVNYNSGGPFSSFVAVRDINGDGKPDLLVATGSVGVLLGNGDGTFQAPAVYDQAGQPHTIAVADVDGDGKPDLLVANSCSAANCWSSWIAVQRGNGDGTFQPPLIYRSGGQSWFVVIADVNTDGNADLLVSNVNGTRKLDSTVGVLLHNTQHTTSISLASSLNPSTYGQAVTFTARVKSTYGTIPDGGFVAFYDGVKMLGLGTLERGTAAYTTFSLSGSAHIVWAVYTGDKVFTISRVSKQQVVVPLPTTTALVSSANPTNLGQPVTFTATVTSAGPTPTGRVWFKNGTTSMGAATLSGGVARFTKSKLAVGTHPITAQYLGDAASDKSTSSVLSQVVNP
jgi:Big-like domain-containing protein/VCBS repeat protein